MQLLFFIPANSDVIAPILSDLVKKQIKGATVIPCEGMLHALYDADIEPPPIFGALRRLSNPAHAEGKIMLLAVDDGMVPAVLETVRTHTGDLNKPDTGVLFTVPISYSEGVAHNE